MTIEFNRTAYTKVFNDLEAYRDYCRFEGKVFNEAALYSKEDPTWIAYQKYQGWLRAKARNGGRDFVPRERKPNPRYNNNRG
jgi:hypothetical protein|tara:strand:+ start:181 stop:426 length:246 start_codon:yes stop_codon:yes gene_type:complete